MNEVLFPCIECGNPTKYKNGKCSKCYEKQNLNNKESEGEIYLAHLFKKWGIAFEKQKKIEGLKGDSRSYRVADFYLPKYNVYIEFNGHYRDHRSQYDEKIKVYKTNKIPCVFLYPENLGFIQFVFDQRIQQVLSECNMIKELKSYRLKKLRQEGIERILWFIVSLVALFSVIVNANNFKSSIEIMVIISFVSIYNSYSFLLLWRSIYKDNSYYDIYK
jgi:hypothetical protein